ncbi:MAG TPA: hypothetical protein PLC52_04730 [Anaerolineales bacterium]|nr:hypothetical protein [Anaerolineales bacterium]HRQ92154.1 hypothetical protein [Anaerolineales bacterium]
MVAILKTTHRSKTAVALIVQQYRSLAGSAYKPATLREFAQALSQALKPIGRSVSYQSIKNWQDRLYLPDTLLMMRLATVARYDWRGEFAADILAAMHPDEYAPLTEIGRKALSNSDEITLTGGQQYGGEKTANHINGERRG